jgi:hypothetical protein
VWRAAARGLSGDPDDAPAGATRTRPDFVVEVVERWSAITIEPPEEHRLASRPITTGEPVAATE